MDSFGNKFEEGSMKQLLVYFVLTMAMVGGIGCDSKLAQNAASSLESKVTSEFLHPSYAYCPDYADHDAMEVVSIAVPHHFDSESVYFEVVDEATIEEEQAEILRLYRWSKKLPDPVDRACWESWLWYYDIQLPEARKSLSEMREQKEYSRTHAFPQAPAKDKP
jgi:hypothetical protein